MQLKEDLIKLLESEKYYAEQELSRLVYHETSLKYKDKLTAICDVLGEITFLEAKITTVGSVFKQNDTTDESKKTK